MILFIAGLIKIKEVILPLFNNSAKRLLLPLISISLLACTSTKAKSYYDQYYFAVLNIAAEEPRKQTRGSDIANGLSDINKKSKVADRLLIDLLDYYIGEGTGAIQEEYIRARGDESISLLLEKKKKPLECLPKYKSICMDKFPNGLERRNERIDWIIDEIRNPGEKDKEPSNAVNY